MIPASSQNFCSSKAETPFTLGKSPIKGAKSSEKKEKDQIKAKGRDEVVVEARIALTGRLIQLQMMI